MKNIRILMMLMGLAAISACSSNETMDAAESDAKAEAEMMKEEQSAAAEAKKAEAEADMKAKQEQAEADMKAKKAAAEADLAAKQAQAEADMKDKAAASLDSGNLVSTCKNGDAVRIISVVYDNDETDTVCEVTYEKSTGVQTLWSANNDRDYCLDQATAFVEKQEGWGWTCSNLE